MAQLTRTLTLTDQLKESMGYRAKSEGTCRNCEYKSLDVDRCIFNRGAPFSIDPEDTCKAFQRFNRQRRSSDNYNHRIDID